MPQKISREEALTRIASERGDTGCLICAIRSGEAGPVWTIREGPHTHSVLSRYPRNWGQAMVLMKRHTTTYTEVTPGEWLEGCLEAQRIAARIEVTLKPLRCYISSLGTWRKDLPMSSPHLHIHIDPVYNAEDRPRTIFTHSLGVLEAEEAEWMTLRGLLAD